MKLRTGLLLIGVGVIFAFAIRLRAPGFDPRTVGYLIIMAGVLGLVLPRRASGRARRGLLIRHYQQAPRPASQQVAESDE